MQARTSRIEPTHRKSVQEFRVLRTAVVREFRQIEWDEQLADDCRQMVRMAVREDLDRLFDWTTVALVPEAVEGRARVVARKPGTLAGLPAAEVLLAEYDPELRWHPMRQDGDELAAGDVAAELAGPARSMLAAERPLLNLLSRLSGIATQTRRYVAAVAGNKARIYDTRKTTPGWRRLEKYAVRMGGGSNHRTGLFDAILIKDNHRAVVEGHSHGSAADAVRQAREFLSQMGASELHKDLPLEVEIDSLADLDDVLKLEPDVVMLDNMNTDDIARAVRRRNELASRVELEASGGVSLETIGALARTGVDRISVGALTHSAPWLDLALDWCTPG